MTARRGPGSGPRRCQRCDAPIVWRLNTASGKPFRLDQSPDDSGDVIVHRNHPPAGELLRATRLAGDELVAAKADGELLFTRHSKTCSALKEPNPKPEGVQIEWPNGRGPVRRSPFPR